VTQNEKVESRRHGEHRETRFFTGQTEFHQVNNPVYPVHPVKYLGVLRVSGMKILTCFQFESLAFQKNARLAPNNSQLTPFCPLNGESRFRA